MTLRKSSKKRPSGGCSSSAILSPVVVVISVRARWPDKYMNVSLVSLVCLVSHHLYWFTDRYSAIVIISVGYTTFQFDLLTTLMPSRPPVHPYTSSSTSTGVHGHHNAAPHQLYKLFANLTFHIIPAKLEDDLARIYQCIDELGGKCLGPEDAWVIVTALKGRQRLLRSLDQKWMVSSR